jgi:hypothetical protein
VHADFIESKAMGALLCLCIAICYDSSQQNTPPDISVVMQQHNMRSVAQNFGTHSFLRYLVPTLRRHDPARTCHRTAASDTAAAATQSEQQQQQQQQHAPHVSVLLQEVLHNLNHMPIKVIFSSVCE